MARGIPLGDNLNIFFGYLINSLGSAIYGPVVALLSGFATEVVPLAELDGAPQRPQPHVDQQVHRQLGPDEQGN